MVGVGEDLKDHFSHLPAMGGDIFHLSRVAQSLIQPGPEQFWGWDVHSFPGQPVPIPHHPHSQEFFPNF